MKKNIHPEYHPVIFLDVGTGKEFFTYSTLKTKNKKTVDGVEYYVKGMDLTSDSHVAYTGRKDMGTNSQSRSQKFKSRFAFGE
jgi:large subunit ribosomal protein L31